jgi:hypothetical protein
MTAPARPRLVEIETTITGRAGTSYRVTVKADGVIQYTLPAFAGIVERVRNRECAKWSNIADEVRAGAIPRIPTLNYETSWRNKFNGQ